MLERIVDAGETVLAEHGYQGMSTNRVATAAGVSPGSLYQYFADKDEIVAEISRRLIFEFNDALTPALRRVVSMTPEQATITLIESVLDALQDRAELLRALVDRVPPAEQAVALREVRLRLADSTHWLLEPHGTSRDREQASWLIAQTLEHLAVRYVLDQPPIPRPEFIDALVRIIGALIPRGSPPAGNADQQP